MDGGLIQGLWEALSRSTRFDHGIWTLERPVRQDSGNGWRVDTRTLGSSSVSVVFASVRSVVDLDLTRGSVVAWEH